MVPPAKKPKYDPSVGDLPSNKPELSSKDNRKRKVPKKSEQSQTSFIDLPFDMVFDIFEKLSIMDLVNLAQVSGDLNCYARSFFQRRYKQFNFMSLREGQMHPIRLEQTRDFFHQFGDFIREMYVPMQIFDDTVSQNDIFTLIAKHCRHLNTFILLRS